MQACAVIHPRTKMIIFECWFELVKIISLHSIDKLQTPFIWSETNHGLLCRGGSVSRRGRRAWNGSFKAGSARISGTCWRCATLTAVLGWQELRRSSIQSSECTYLLLPQRSDMREEYGDFHSVLGGCRELNLWYWNYGYQIDCTRTTQFAGEMILQFKVIFVFSTIHSINSCKCPTSSRRLAPTWWKLRVVQETFWLIIRRLKIWKSITARWATTRTSKLSSKKWRPTRKGEWTANFQFQYH